MEEDKAIQYLLLLKTGMDNVTGSFAKNKLIDAQITLFIAFFFLLLSSAHNRMTIEYYSGASRKEPEGNSYENTDSG